MDIGNNIKYYRQNLNLTQKDLANKTGLSEISIRKYENNSRNPKYENLRKIASALNVSIGCLTDYSEDDNIKNIILDELKENFKKTVLKKYPNEGFPTDLSLMTTDEIKKLNDLRNAEIQEEKDITYLGLSFPEYLFDVISKFVNNSTNKTIDINNINRDEKIEIINKIVDLFEFEIFKLSKK